MFSNEPPNNDYAHRKKCAGRMAIGILKHWWNIFRIRVWLQSDLRLDQKVLICNLFDKEMYSKF